MCGLTKIELLKSGSSTSDALSNSIKAELPCPTNPHPSRQQQQKQSFIAEELMRGYLGNSVENSLSANDINSLEKS